MSREVITGAELGKIVKADPTISAALTALQDGQVLAVTMRNTSTDDSKVLVEFAEKISLSNTPQSALAIFNPGDDRFSSGARRNWALMSRDMAEKMFSVEIPEDKAFAFINQVLKPHASGDFRIRVIEFLESELTDGDREYSENYLKRIPSTGAYFIDGATSERVCVRTQLVLVPRNADGSLGDPQHVLKVGEYKTASTKDALAEAHGLSSNFAG